MVVVVVEEHVVVLVVVVVVVVVLVLDQWNCPQATNEKLSTAKANMPQSLVVVVYSCGTMLRRKCHS